MRGVLLPLGALLAALFMACAAAAPAGAADDDTQAAYLADRLRENPVYITDQLPRETPKSMTRDFAAVAKGIEVPTYVLVLPYGAGSGRDLLEAVHDRLGRDGLYVLLDDATVEDARAFGVSAPAEDAATVSLYELPYDAGSLRAFELFAEVVAEGAQKAAERADAARVAYADDSPPDLYIGPTDRENQTTLTAVLVAGVPTLLLLLFPYVRRWRGRLRGTTGRSGNRWTAPLLALVSAVAVAVIASQVFDQTTSSATPPPRAVDLEARTDRVAEALAKDPVYVDGESPPLLDRARLARLHTRIERFERSEGGGPVFVTLVPQIPEDESANDAEAFVAAVRDKTGSDGVYIVADPLSGYIDIYNHGLALDRYGPLYDLPDSVTYGDDRSYDADDFLLGDRLDTVLKALEQTERTDEPLTPGDPYPVPNAATEDDLEPLFGGEFWPGLFLGGMAGLLAFGLAAALLGILGGVVRRRRPLPVEALPVVSPSEPTESYLRQTAWAELRAMPSGGDVAEAALLLVDGDAKNLRGADPMTLLTVIVLARAARTGQALCCAVNPLHGPAASRRHVRLSHSTNRRQMLPLCPACLDSAVASPGKLPDLRLTLPAPPPGDRRVPYDEDTSRPLSALPSGVARVAEKVRTTRSGVPAS
ncbi:hypothetical protein [Streptomyces sp. NPDC000983]|uniref:hypothetical protein n=1 Tax=Streptomyces sp. NPDC000983 TaxID=3154373 RepID=UPI00331D3E7D